MLATTFIIISIVSVILFYYGTGKDKRVLIFSLLWLCAVAGIAYTGYYENTSARPPRFLFVLITAIVLAVFCYKNVRDHKIIPNYLIAIHALRLPVELVIYQLFLGKQVPVVMTFAGWNFDIVIGVSALLILICRLLFKIRFSDKVMLVWNATGLLFLFVIVSIAILSSPLPIQQLAFDQPNVAVLKFPFVLLPAIVVPIVCLSHVLAIRILRKNGAN